MVIAIGLADTPVGLLDTLLDAYPFSEVDVHVVLLANRKRLTGIDDQLREILFEFLQRDVNLCVIHITKDKHRVSLSPEPDGHQMKFHYFTLAFALLSVRWLGKNVAQYFFGTPHRVGLSVVAVPRICAAAPIPTTRRASSTDPKNVGLPGTWYTIFMANPPIRLRVDPLVLINPDNLI